MTLGRDLFSILITGVLVLQFAIPASAIRNADQSGSDTGAVHIYNFNGLAVDANGLPSIIPDASGNGLNLTPSRSGNLPTTADLRIKVTATSTSVVLNEKPFDMGNGYQRAQKDRSFLINANPSPSLNQCASSGITIQAFIRPFFPFQGSRVMQNGALNGKESGNLIVGVTNSVEVPSNFSGTRTADNTAIPNFAIYQANTANSPARILFRVRGQGGVPLDFYSTDNFVSLTKEDNAGKWNEVIATMEPNGNVGVYLNRVPSLYRRTMPVEFLNSGRLVMGNDLVKLNDLAPMVTENNVLQLDPESLVKDQRNWSGEIAHVAIYCRGFSSAEIMTAYEQYRVKDQVVVPDISSPITPARRYAQKMFGRLAGMAVPVDHPDVIKMEAHLAAGRPLEAAKVVTGDKGSNVSGHPGFYNIVVKQFGLLMSNRQETIRANLNDMAATVVGVTRDETNAKELLTGDYFYMGDASKIPVSSDLKSDVLESNRHFQQLDDPTQSWDLGKVLVRIEGQRMVRNESGDIVPHPDPGGVLTSRAFMSEHAIAGTNRRLVEYAFRSFMCTPMNEMADTSGSTTRIGRDVDRRPGGDASKFETTCKGCHSVMDGFRGAFAKFDFSDGLVKHSGVHGVKSSDMDKYGFSNNGPFSLRDPDTNNVTGIVQKLNHNQNVFPAGHQVLDDSFVNNAIGVRNREWFGWQGENARGGVGVGQFGRMIADSNRFPQCMAKRVYEAICLPSSTYDYQAIKDGLNRYADSFVKSNYNLKKLFQEMATNTACIKP
jgi:hypothetical protein